MENLYLSVTISKAFVGGQSYFSEKELLKIDLVVDLELCGLESDLPSFKLSLSFFLQD